MSDELGMNEILKGNCLVEFFQDSPLPLDAEGGGILPAFHPLLQPLDDLRIPDVFVFGTDGSTVSLVQVLHDIAQPGLPDTDE